MKKYYLLLMFLSACSMPSVKQPIDAKVFYKRDMKMRVNGKSGIGVMVVPKSTSYTIQGDAHEEVALVGIQTTHRTIEIQEFEDKRFTASFVPQIESEQFGLIRMAIFDKENGQNSWGEVYIEDPEGLPATLKCNGLTLQGKTSACQAASSLEQEIHFTQEVAANPDEGSCNVPEMSRTGKDFKFIMPQRNCVIVFAAIDNGIYRTHKLYTTGYQEVFLRGKK